MCLLAYVVLAPPSNVINLRMGCVNSRTDINDLHPNVFQVMNVDDLGNLITPGRLEVTESDIILYQRSKSPVKWPLRCLRRYGYDAEIFSFESGRRCSTGPGIYAFKCRRAAQLFNLVQTYIQQVCNNGDDAISREMPIGAHSGPTVTRVAIPMESNYLDPTSTRSNGRILSSFSNHQQNGRLSSIGSSSGPISPQGTMSSPSPPPMLPASLPPPPPIPHFHSSLYVNEEALQAVATADLEHNNNKSLARRSMQRSHTVSSSISTNGLLSFEQVSGQIVNCEVSLSKQNRAATVQSSAPSYINVDLNSDGSPLSPLHKAYESSTSFKDEGITEQQDGSCNPTYMNISPRQEKLESVAPIVKARPPALLILQQQQQSESEDGSRHFYANLEASELEGLKKRFSATSIVEKLPVQTPPPLLNVTAAREMSYAVLDLDKNNAPSSNIGTAAIITAASTSASTSASTTASTTMTITSTESSVTPQLPPSSSPPDSPLKSQQIGYVTIDFNKTAALSHSVNSCLISDIDEGSRKTRHNSTISELISPSSRHNSSMSE
ncbi:PREDICTED: serine/threonine-protein kinase pakG [Ceratosolen solmsi marchali]|uniref:Serine/threonine-protein kinase pakG n=1 Tax=Ceratosolen solmsi marchali TaxID=326594 RepID=A0AAJ6YIT3_9HYME|nr:PREDICTED: serine/threonine-protein kinase pakG [Ceratosolen solmsi marchali]